MPSLKDLKIRIGSVKSTQKITKAMQMVAAAKLRRATERTEAARPYAEHLESLLCSLATGMEEKEGSKLLTGTGKDNTHLIVVMTSDRGLCGGFNTSIVRSVKTRIASLQAEGKEVKLFCIGRKGIDQLESQYGSLIVGRITDAFKKNIVFSEVVEIVNKVLDVFDEHACDTCTIVYNAFKSAMLQEVTYQQIIPLDIKAFAAASDEGEATASLYEYEPEEEVIMNTLLPKNINVQIFKALLENAASEQGSRMTAMDSATRNAGEMIDDLTQQYNRSRQASITKELIEIISGAEAV